MYVLVGDLTYKVSKLCNERKKAKNEPGFFHILNDVATILWSRGGRARSCSVVPGIYSANVVPVISHPASITSEQSIVMRFVPPCPNRGELTSTNKKK